MRNFTLLLLLIGLALPAAAQEGKPFQVVFYNVENLFDTIDHPVKRDEEYTPGSEKKWNAKRYQTKLNHLGKVLEAAGGEKKPPHIIGLCEIENRQVVSDLLKTGRLKKGKYQIVHEESPDKRGIDVAFAYSKKAFRYLSHETIPVNFPDTTRKTREILHVTGLAYKKDTVHFFINHWPSRWGGQQKSEPNRLLAAYQLRVAVDKLQKRNPNAKIVITGDFNDEPHNKSIVEILSAGESPNPVRPNDLYNLSLKLDNDGQGSYNYKGNWNMIDQMIVSYPLANANTGLTVSADQFEIVKPDFLMYTTKDGKKRPSRTYGGKKYYGGYSDHLAIKASMYFKK